jgi:hypothetical protein
MRRDIGRQRQRAGRAARARRANAGAAADRLEVDHGARRDHPVTHQRDQIGPAGDEHIAASHLAAHLGETRDLVVLESFHATPRRLVVSAFTRPRRLGVSASRFISDRGAR